MRLRIIGGCGSGKSTLAQALAPYEGKTLRVTKAMPTGEILAALEDIL